MFRILERPANETLILLLLLVPFVGWFFYVFYFMVSSDGSTYLVATIGIFISVLSFVVSIKTLYRTESSLALTKDSLALTEESLILSMCERKRKDLVDSLKYFYYPFISFWGG